ncbi:MAG: protein translocase subunit SecD [Candidatus Magasanikbacteria bacterium]|nr:protein translocase subunit SecD [Candidatus Magasanikbacteria bacterium]MBT4314739.1 protein translocase subunit SecD [Candidatus Magasanikbacteria bacterium]MBT4547516.1 protein translocase subunit SecD [Candidatus Magasanikbacteria bacterium]MBT6819418.1 protein translocase subunit SecD [Candidatus Magasanikbacteria bacterium]
MKKNNTKSQVRAKVRWGIVGILALLLLAGSFDAPGYFNRAINKVNAVTYIGLPNIPEKNFNLGLDLQGGAHLVYQANTSGLTGEEKGPSVEGVRDVIERRVNGIGVSEPVVQTTKVGDDYRIIVEMPGVTDINEAIKMIGETPILEFKEQNDEPSRELTEEERQGMNDFNKEVKTRAGEALQKIKSGSDFAEVVTEYSEDLVSKNNDGYMSFIGVTSQYPELYEWAGGVSEGTVSATLTESYEGYNILKRGAERDGDGQISASHILICYLGSESCDSPIYTKKEALEKAQEIYDQANAGNFAQLAIDNSTDFSNKDEGGDLGYFGRGMMVPEFEEAVFNADVSQIVGPVETQFGYHVIYKTDEKPSKEYEMWRVMLRTKKEIDILPPSDPWKNTDLSGKQLERSEVVSDPQTGAVQVSLGFDNEGKELFKEITTRNVGLPVAIFLDGQPISVPTVNEPISDGRAVISGSFNLQEARLLSQRLNAGALPVPIELIAQQSVGASLGAKSLNTSLKAGVVGILIVMLFMLLYYRLPGLLSVIALTLYVTLTLAVFKLIGVTLTLAGIAGFILSIGMAVDANVLIFERLKEELKEGKSLKAAVEEGFLRAWTSIRDGNISTLITCVLLIWFGTSFVQGFAVTLAIGVLLSMFSAITVTRVLLRFVAPWFKEHGSWLFLGYKKQ